ncbi:MAG: RsmD family RNA methyltransferase [Planctomycetota bacterium]
MRIVAGRFGGRRIAPPPTDATRPMLDRVREALFSTLGEAVDGAQVLDLYSGTGSLGLEALSRGASFVRFVERDAATRRVLAENVALLDVGGEAEVLVGDALAVRARETPARFLEPEGGADAARWVDLALIDPPYPHWKELAQRKAILATLEDLLARRARPGATLVLHTHPRDVAERELRFAASAEARDYNNSRLWYLR